MNKTSVAKTGSLVILSAPSGCGKTTIVSRLLRRHPKWVRSISVTTRPPRLGEKDGKDYEFASVRRFLSLRKKKAFLEWARVFGHFYGTKRRVIQEAVRRGETALLAIDVQGSRKVRRALGEREPLFSIFVLPPSIQVLRERLVKRASEAPDEIERRIQIAQ